MEATSLFIVWFLFKVRQVYGRARGQGGENDQGVGEGKREKN